MSADNYMAVRKMADKWHVWMVLGGYDQEEWEVPSGPDHREFAEEMDAVDYAFRVCEETLVEYGVVRIP